MDIRCENPQKPTVPWIPVETRDTAGHHGIVLQRCPHGAAFLMFQCFGASINCTALGIKRV